jgi:transposase
LVGREQQGSLFLRPGRARSGAQKLERLTHRPPQGPTGRFPEIQEEWRSRDACRFTTGQIKVLGDRKHVQLPRIGVLKTHESTRKLASRLEQGSARILSGTISRTADRWFVSFTVEVQRHLPGGNGKTTVVGVDVGVRQLAVLSNGTTIANPRARRSAASSPTRQPGTAAGWWWPTGSIPLPRRAQPAVG